MTINEWCEDIHANSINHGWWEEPRPIAEIFALIHAELSEALEEARAGRPPVWYEVMADCSHCTRANDLCDRICEHETCRHKHKPEGIAIELLDAAIRMMDYLGHENISIEGDIDDLVQYAHIAIATDDGTPAIGSEIGMMHYCLDVAFCPANFDRFADNARTFLADVIYTVKRLGCDPEKLMLEKHLYNKTRAWKHGKKF